MPHSPLATISVPAYGGNYTEGRPNGGITKITVHHMAGVLSAEQCGAIFQRPGRNGSSHYGIGVDGEIAVYVEEENTAWTDSNWDSNIHSVTIEDSNSATGGDWPISDATYNSLIKLVADIAKRNGLGTLVPGQNLTWHSMYAATSCPGDFLRARMQNIADEANKINSGGPAPTPTGVNVGDKVVLNNWVDYNGTPLMKTRDYYYVSEINGDRAVLRADSISGTVYCAANVNNLTKIDGSSPAPAPEPEPTPEPTPEPAPAPAEGFKVGDIVVPTRLVDYNGTPLKQYDDTYTITQINGDRAVLSAPRNGKMVIWAAMRVSDIRKA